MSIKIYNTLNSKKEEFKPIKKNKVNIYVCGPTVYDDPHIGHARSAYVFDVIRRYFIYKKYKVTFVRNVTDVDDKIIDKAKKELKGEDLNSAVKKISKKYLKTYHKYMDELGIASPDKEPKATEYIDKMKDFISILIKRKIAYISEGDVYFDVKKAKNYGKLSNQTFEMLESGARVTPGENKSDPLDFALWKSSKEGEPSWDSPWGKGRPGWHIECSVMSSDILGDEFDIHGGGIDLIFPHHENEIAQSEGAGKKFAHYWIHNGLLTINKEKMAKSLGNFISIEDILKKYPSDILKVLFMQSHYSHPVDFSWERMEEVKTAYNRFTILFQKLDKKPSKSTKKGYDSINKFKKEFEDAMDDDFNTPIALRVLFDMVKESNRILDSDQDNKMDILRYAKETILELSGILGLSFKDIKEEKSDTWVTKAIAQREQYRKDKKYKDADEVRKTLEAKGIILEDTKDGKTTWRRK